MLLTILISVAVLAALIYIKVKKTTKVEDQTDSYYEKELNIPEINNFVMVEEDPIVVTEQPVEPSIKKASTPTKKATQTAKKSTSKKAKKQ